MKATTTALLTLACSVGLAATVAAQVTTQPAAQTTARASVQDTTGVKTDIPAALAREAKISLDSARAIATKRVPNGTIRSQELEREHGRLIYSFDMKVGNRAGITEVNVNARTGAVVGVSHEGAKAEAREAAQERRETRHAKRDSVKDTTKK
jgi:uncharacterized membrane protein YkoI